MLTPAQRRNGRTDAPCTTRRRIRRRKQNDKEERGTRRSPNLTGSDSSSLPPQSGFSHLAPFWPRPARAHGSGCNFRVSSFDFSRFEFFKVRRRSTSTTGCVAFNFKLPSPEGQRVRVGRSVGLRQRVRATASDSVRRGSLLTWKTRQCSLTTHGPQSLKFDSIRRANAPLRRCLQCCTVHASHAGLAGPTEAQRWR
ncbi:hypothetical protein L226DRAFT_175314 [Lentinus tigrinus ALCF2SS1-7]|uniref:Uncharacterized protein n=1 Tax=Lentinus tigrinus ALCF2SS1-6 TaxID=1328759 RepID=A0A5C2RZD5_9APHY|nr:hypothetical protein L227DRAFT_258693 [Lentinus tigrinus ALCF2SS1-6]RPD71431.1 hypothetical protein L226DRAFT_175314 [Lentinus tigrinus ALCF2SS1-7]